MNDQLTQIKQSIIQGLQQNPQQVIQSLVSSEQGKQIIQVLTQAAQQGDEESAQILQAVQQGIKQLQQPVMAKQGAKLNYMRSLKNQCPEGEELMYFKAGGKVCSKCMKKMKKAEQGTKVKKDCGGGITSAMKMIKAELGTKAPKDISPNDTIHENGKAYSLVNINGPRTKKYTAITNEMYQKWLKQAKNGDKEAARKVRKQQAIQEEKCGGKAKRK